MQDGAFPGNGICIHTFFNFAKAHAIPREILAEAKEQAGCRVRIVGDVGDVRRHVEILAEVFIPHDDGEAGVGMKCVVACLPLAVANVPSGKAFPVEGVS